MSEKTPLAKQYGITSMAAKVAQLYASRGDAAEVSKRLGLPRSKIRSYLRDQRVQNAIQSELRRRLGLNAPKMLEVIQEIAQSAPDDRVRLQAAKDWLDRAGWSPQHMHVSADKAAEQSDPKELESRIRQLMKDLGLNEEDTGIKVIEGEGQEKSAEQSEEQSDGEQ